MKKNNSDRKQVNIALKAPKKKKWVTVVAVIAILWIIGTAIGGGKDDKKPTKATDAKAKTGVSTSEAKANTSAKVDEILSKAIDDAKAISEDDATQKWEEAFDYLKAHSANFYENNDVMEQSMYYGEFIYQYIEANANASNISQLVDSTRAAYDVGYNTVKAIKYVYRNEATTEDPDTTAALQKAQEALNKFQ